MITSAGISLDGQQEVSATVNSAHRSTAFADDGLSNRLATSSNVETSIGMGVSGLRVLHVIDRLSMGGTQNLLMRSLAELGRRGVESHLCVLSSDQHTDASYQDQVEPTYLDFPGEYRNPWSLNRCVRQLRTVMDEVRPDIVHSYLWVSDIVTALAQENCLPGHVSHIVDRRDWQASRRLVHRLRRWATQRAFRRARTRFVAVSHAARDYACQHMAYAPDRVAVASNGIDWKQFAGQRVRAGTSGPVVLGIAGRLEEEKGHRILMDAMAGPLLRERDVQLKVTGDGPLRRELESLVKQRGLNRRIEFLGWLPSVRDFYQSIDVFVVPSISAEGLPTTILEAMASGCVVVATDVGGAGEAIRDGVDGFLIPPRDVRALADGIDKLLKRPEGMTEMAESARHRIREQFTTERMIDVVCETYQALLKTREFHS